jgi:predicted DNA-binding transcriptional regulator AlpA
VCRSKPTPPTSASPLNGLLRKKEICADLGINPSTLDAMIKRDDFPPPIIISSGQQREILGWLESEYRAWKDSRPKRIG